MTRLRVPRRPRRQEFSISNFQFSIERTHAISIFSSVSNVSRLPPVGLSRQASRSVENGCKDTTIFNTAKIFFHLFSVKNHFSLWLSMLGLKLFFQKTGKYNKNRPKNGPEMGRKGQNSASSIAHFRTHSFILLNINNINKIIIDSDSFCKLTFNTLLKCMRY